MLLLLFLLLVPLVLRRLLGRGGDLWQLDRRSVVFVSIVELEVEFIIRVDDVVFKLPYLGHHLGMLRGLFLILATSWSDAGGENRSFFVGASRTRRRHLGLALLAEGHFTAAILRVCGGDLLRFLGRCLFLFVLVLRVNRRSL